MTTAYVLGHYLYLANDILSDTKQIARRRAQCTGEKKGASRVYTLQNTTRLPPQKVMLTVTRNKVQLIDLICEDMAFHKEYFSQHKLVLTGSDPVPVEINSGVIVKRQDMKTTQEEADAMIVQQVAEVKAKKVLWLQTTLIYMFFCFTYVAKVIFQFQPLY